jgi:hypothetical protein
MKSTAIGCTLLLSAVLLWSPAARGEEGLLPGKIGSYGSYYDTATEETFTARVVQVHAVDYSRFSKACLALEVMAEGEEQTEIVYLGPKKRLERAGFAVQQGADVCIVASRVEIEGQTVLISKSVIDGRDQIGLRSADGKHLSLDLRTDPDRGYSVCTIAGSRVR